MLAATGLLWPLFSLREPPRVRRKPISERVAWRLRGCNVRDRLVTPGSDVCIEGFPRSANSFAVFAFRQWNRDARIAHHLHAPFQLRLAVRFGVPCCVLVREPLGAISSVISMSREQISDDACCRSYVRFHRSLAELRDEVAICRFEEVVVDPSIAVVRLNRRFGTSFAARTTTPELETLLLGKLRRRASWSESPFAAITMAVPNSEKEARKVAIRERIELNPLLAEARAAYAAVCGGGDLR